MASRKAQVHAQEQVQQPGKTVPVARTGRQTSPVYRRAGPCTKIYGLTQAKFQPDKCPAKQRELSEKKLSEN